MRIALYIGDHKGDAPHVRLGWWVTRLVQKGKYKQVTHVEAILDEHEDGTVTIGSASLRDGGVRTKERVRLNPRHWLIADVPQWDVESAREWFIEHDGEPYDWRGAFATCMPFSWDILGQWFCNGATGASGGLQDSEKFGPAQFAAICFSFGRDVTEEFFKTREQ